MNMLTVLAIILVLVTPDERAPTCVAFDEVSPGRADGRLTCGPIVFADNTVTLPGPTRAVGYETIVIHIGTPNQIAASRARWLTRGATP